MEGENAAMAATPMISKKATRALLRAALAATLGFAPAAHALEFGSTRLRLGPPLDAGDISGGALALTLEPEAAPWWLTWLGDDVHYEVAASVWNNAARDDDNVYTAHLGPVWKYRPSLLGDRGFVEWGTSVAYVSEPQLEDRDLGGNGHFTTHAVVGWYLNGAERWHLGLRARHTSNAGLESPNPGLDIVMLELGYHFSSGI